jgi:hypothetical protein
MHWRESLSCLIQELLDVDRHRRTLAENYSQLERASEVEAQLQLQGAPSGVRHLAKMLSVSASTVTRWRRDPSYLDSVENHKKMWGLVLRDDYFETIRAAHPDATEAECYRKAFQMYVESIPQRRARYSKPAGGPT